VTQLFDRALAFQRRTLELVADEFRPIEEGWVVRCAGLRLVWNLNEVRVARAIDYAEAVELVGQHLGDLPYRQLVVEHQPSGELLEERFHEAGWRVDREVTMVLARAPGDPSAGVQVIEPGERESLALMRRWTSEDPDLKLSGEALEQVLEACRRSWRARNATRLGVLGRDGSLGAMTLLYTDGKVAQVEDVYTVPEERRRGFARATVAAAASLAESQRHELTFIGADDKDWPKHLYAELGFEPVGRVWRFHREVKSG
jgi:GNAT superfamily N-acetyltransferase